jgi:hypothetical protein
MTVYLELYGEPKPVDDLVWAFIAPCGCLSGLLVAGLAHTPSYEPVVSEEQAWREYYPSAATMRNQDKKAGFTCKLMTRQQAAAKGIGKCPHLPRWGVPETPHLEGYEWVIYHNTRSQHLVEWLWGDETKIPFPDYEVRKQRFAPTSLCGRQKSWFWERDGDTYDKPECGSCLKKAASIVKKQPVQLEMEEVDGEPGTTEGRTDVGGEGVAEAEAGPAVEPAGVVP